MRRRVIPARRYALRVSVRLTGALVAALALLAVLPAGAAAQLSRDAQRVYDDYRSDAEIEPCDHEVAVYRRTLREITPDIEEETPAFRPAVEAAQRERRRRGGDCAVSDEPQGQDGGSAAPAPAAPAPPAAEPAPANPPPAEPAPAPPANEGGAGAVLRRRRPRRSRRRRRWGAPRRPRPRRPYCSTGPTAARPPAS